MDIKNSGSAAFHHEDGSEIRELLAYRNSVIRNQSLAEAGCRSAAALRNTIIGAPRRLHITTAPQDPVDGERARSVAARHRDPPAPAHCGIPGRRFCGCSVLCAGLRRCRYDYA